MKRKKEIDRSLFLLLFMMIIIITAALFLYLQVRSDKMSEMILSDSIVSVLFIVTDEDKPLLTELFLFYSDTGKGALLDIPGYTGSIIQKLEKVDRIDILFDIDNVHPYLSKISRLTGVDIPFFYIISLNQLQNMVDLLDGLELFIANPVDIKSENNIILLPSGSVNLDGSKIRSYLNYSFDGESDAEKIDRNQKFLKSFIEKMASRKNYLSTDDLFKFIQKNIKTNMDRKSFENLLAYISELDIGKLIYHKVLGVKRVVDSQELLFPYFDEMLLKETVKQIEDNLVNSGSLSEKGIAFSIEILNGTDIDGLASRTAQVLKSFGYKISGIGDATRTDGNEYENTVILDRKGDPDGAKGLADLIKCKRWYSETDETLDDTIDITIILGKDFDGRYVK